MGHPLGAGLAWMRVFYSPRAKEQPVKAAKKATRVSSGNEAIIRSFIGKFGEDLQAQIRAIRKAIRKQLPTANELVYDNYNFFVIGYSSTERPSDSVVSIVADRNGVRLAFPYVGAKLADPHGLLQGSGSQNRFIRLESPEDLQDPRLKQLIQTACNLLSAPMPVTGSRKLVIRSISKKQRSRK
jgi:hypothetical protein